MDLCEGTATEASENKDIHADIHAGKVPLKHWAPLLRMVTQLLRGTPGSIIKERPRDPTEGRALGCSLHLERPISLFCPVKVTS